MKSLLVAVDSKFIHSNLAVRYIKSFCENDFDIKIREFTINQNNDYIAGEILREKADIICFSCYIWNIECIKDLIFVLKAAREDIKILVGGPEVSFEVEKFMEENPLIDFVVYGEGEETIREFLQVFQASGDLSKVNGIAYRQGDSGKICVNEPRELLTNLDLLKSPYLNGEDYEDKMVYYESSRGCPFNCAFCMSSIDKTVRVFSMERVKFDLSMLLNTNARQIKFVDRTFNANYKRSMEIMSYIVENNKSNKTVHFEITADIINDEFLDFLRKMPVNMFQFEVGVQSLNEETLAAINRKMNADKLFQVVNKIKDNANMHLHLDLIAGLPFEDYKSFAKSFNGIHNLYVDKLQLGFLKVLKGTNIYNNRDNYGIRYDRKAPYEIISNKFISYEEILKLKNIEELVDKYYNERYFDVSVKFIIEKYHVGNAFEFYERFSLYWQENGLYNGFHNRKKLYAYLWDYTVASYGKDEELREKMLFDFVASNEKEELISIFDRSCEDKFRIIKRELSKNQEFRRNYLGIEDDKVRILNEFRIVEIGEKIWLFVYNNKDNIFDRCKTYDITGLECLGGIENEEVR